MVVRDPTPPPIPCPTPPPPIPCPTTPVFPAPTVTDTCDSSPSVSSNDVTTAGSCAGTYSVPRTWTVRDCRGNTATCSQTVVVRDITPPTVSSTTAPSPSAHPPPPVFTA